MVYFVLFVFVIGLIIGSFLNVVLYRMHTKESLGGRSKCPSCQTVIAWYDNFPVVSYIMLSGKCRHCNALISYNYPLVEGITGVLFALAFFVAYPYTTSMEMFSLIVTWIFIATLIIIFFYDLRWYLILDIVTIPVIVFAFVANVVLGEVWWKLLLAAAIGGGFFLLQFLVSKGRWIGGGDIRLGVLMGVMVGFPMILVAMMAAYLIGTIISLPLVFLGNKQMGDKIPFGTFLALATVITLLYGNNILAWYLTFF